MRSVMFGSTLPTVLVPGSSRPTALVRGSTLAAVLVPGSTLPTVLVRYAIAYMSHRSPWHV
jgi:hypothetical protein